MATQINFTYEGKSYCLEFTRKSVSQMERSGFRASEVLEMPMSMLPDFFAGAFIANHKYVKRDVIDAIFDKMKDKNALLETLTKMYNEPLVALMADGEEGNEIQWETT